MDTHTQFSDDVVKFQGERSYHIPLHPQRWLNAACHSRAIQFHYTKLKICMSLLFLLLASFIILLILI